MKIERFSKYFLVLLFVVFSNTAKAQYFIDSFNLSNLNATFESEPIIISKRNIDDYKIRTTNYNLKTKVGNLNFKTYFESVSESYFNSPFSNTFSIDCNGKKIYSKKMENFCVLTNQRFLLNYNDSLLILFFQTETAASINPLKPYVKGVGDGFWQYVFRIISADSILLIKEQNLSNFFSGSQTFELQVVNSSTFNIYNLVHDSLKIIHIKEFGEKIQFHKINLNLFDTIVSPKTRFNNNIEVANNYNTKKVAISYSIQHYENLEKINYSKNGLFLVNLNDEYQVSSVDSIFSGYSFDDKYLVSRIFDFKFSNLDRYLYYTFSENPVPNNFVSELRRFNLESKKNELLHSSKNIERPYNYFYLGQNNKIYLTGGFNRDISIIKYPDSGLIENNGVYPYLDNFDCGRTSLCGLYVPSHFYHGIPLGFRFGTACDSSLVLINTSDSSRLQDFTWYIESVSNSNYRDSMQGFQGRFKPGVEGLYFVKFKTYSLSGWPLWYSDTVKLDFSNLVQPKAALEISNNPTCQYADFSFIDQSEKGIFDEDSQYWELIIEGKSQVFKGNMDTIRMKIMDTGLLDVKIRYYNGYCLSERNYLNVLSVLPAPKPGIELDKTSGCLPFVLKYNSKYKDPLAQEIIWSFGEGTQRFYNQYHVDSFEYQQGGNYWIKQELKGSNGCISKDSINVQVKQGFDLTKDELDLKYITRINWGNDIKAEWNSLAYATEYSWIWGRDSLNLNQLYYQGMDTVGLDQITSNGMQYYQIKAKDVCGKEIRSNKARHKELKAELGEKGVELQWDSYINWKDGIGVYELEKSIDGQDFKLIYRGNGTEYIDENFYNSPSDSALYRIKALSSQYKYESRGNEIVVKRPFEIHIPNAFTPNGDPLNAGFRIELKGIEEENYEQRIYNRWGTEVYASRDSKAYFTGEKEGIIYPEGVYIYKLKCYYRDDQGKLHQIIRSGSFVMIR